VKPPATYRPIHQIEQRIRPPIETVVHLAPEPAKFALVTTADLPDTTNNGHLIVPRRFASSSESEQVAAFCQSLNRATDHQADVEREARTSTTAVAPHCGGLPARADGSGGKVLGGGRLPTFGVDISLLPLAAGPSGQG
jgi:hypothetical protein